MTAAEIIAARQKALGGGDGDSADQPLPANNPGEAYTNYIGGPAFDYVRNFLNQALPGHPMNDMVAGTIAPETLTQVGATAGALLAPEAKAAQYFGSEARNAPWLAPILKRIMAPVTGGAVGGLAEKGSPIDSATGAVIGAVTGIPAEVASGVSRWYAGSKLAQRFFKEDPEMLSGVVRKLVPEYGSIATPEDFGKQVWQGVAQDTASKVYDKRMSNVAEKAMASAPAVGPMKAYDFLSAEQPLIGPGGVVNSPRIAELKQQGVLSKGMKTVQDLMDDIRDLRLKGRTSGGDPKMTLDGRQARDYAAEVSSDLYDAIGANDPRLANYYKKTDQKYARFAEINRYLKQPGIIDDNGQIDMGLLQAQLKEESARGLAHDFTPTEFKQLADAVFRGAPPTVIDDINKPHPERIRAHISESGRVGVFANILSMFRNNKYAGNYDVDFLKPKGVTVGLQRLGAGALQSLDRPISLAAPEIDQSE